MTLPAACHTTRALPRPAVCHAPARTCVLGAAGSAAAHGVTASSRSLPAPRRVTALWVEQQGQAGKGEGGVGAGGQAQACRRGAPAAGANLDALHSGEGGGSSQEESE